jgi:hypothetical protein
VLTFAEACPADRGYYLVVAGGGVRLGSRVDLT